MLAKVSTRELALLICTGVQLFYSVVSPIINAYLIWGTHAAFKRMVWISYNVLTIASLIVEMAVDNLDRPVVLGLTLITGTTILSMKKILVCDDCAAMNKSFTMFCKVSYCHYCGEELNQNQYFDF